MNDNNKKWAFRDYGEFNIFPMRDGKEVYFELGVSYYLGLNDDESEVTTDALEVYRALKDYFKGSKYE